jgi:hypothetical protein
MRFICLGYFDEAKWNALTPEQQKKAFDDCFAYDDELRRGGHIVGGEALASYRDAVTLRMQNGNVIASDGPYAETKEHIGGILIIEARDMNHAVELMSRHPGNFNAPWEIRPSATKIKELFEQRQAAARQK